MSDAGAPLKPARLEEIAREIVRRMPGCPEPNCSACASNLRGAREWVQEAFDLGALAPRTHPDPTGPAPRVWIDGNGEYHFE